MSPTRTAEKLYVLLSQALVAYTMEFDNEFEMCMSTLKPRRFRLSMAMWSNFMRFVDEQGITVRELESKADLLNHMEWWGYVRVAPPADDIRKKPPRGDWMVYPAAPGNKARAEWPPLFGEIEARWETRFGKPCIDGLKKLLAGVYEKYDCVLPQYLPVIGYGLRPGGLYAKLPIKDRSSQSEEGEQFLPVLLSRVLAMFAREVETESELSMAMCADVVRNIDDTAGARVRDLPLLGGVSKEAIAVGLSYLTKKGYAVEGHDAASPTTKVVHLTDAGRGAKRQFAQVVEKVEANWNSGYGTERLADLRTAVVDILEREVDGKPLLSQGLIPYPTGWRAERLYITQTNTFLANPRKALPHYPMVTHRGAWPDGS